MTADLFSLLPVDPTPAAATTPEAAAAEPPALDHPARPVRRRAAASPATPADDGVDWAARAAEIRDRWAASTAAARAKFEHPTPEGPTTP